MGKRTDYAMLRQGFGLARGLSDEFIQACERVNPPIEAIHRLVTPNGRVTMDEIVRRAVADWQAEQPKPAGQDAGDPLPSNGHPYRGYPQRKENTLFSAPVVYIQPKFEELKRWFPAYVNPDYKGKRFDPIGRCEGISRENREVAFEYVHLNRDASTDEVLAEMDRQGLRPALYEELLGFAEKYPDEQRKYPIVALGSEARVFGLRYVAYLWDGDDGRSLRLLWIDRDWYGDCRFLAVRK